MMNQSGVDGDTGRVIYQLGLRFNQEDKLIFEVLAPLGVQLAPGLDVEVDGKKQLSMSYINCINQGCLAQKEISKEVENIFRKGESGLLNLTGMQGKKGGLPFSLKGFVKAANKLYERK